MGESSVKEKLAEQWGLVRSAPLPYAAGLMLIAGLMFAVFQWGYARVIDGLHAQMATVTEERDAARAERDDLKSKLAAMPLQTEGADTHSIYQLGEKTATTSEPVFDRSKGIVQFGSIEGTQDFNINASMSYGIYTLKSCNYTGMSGTKYAEGAFVGQMFGLVTCQIQGLHP